MSSSDIREDHLLDAHFLDERLRFDDGAHGARGPAAHEIEQHLPQDQIQRIMLDVVTRVQ